MEAVGTVAAGMVEVVEGWVEATRAGAGTVVVGERDGARLGLKGQRRRGAMARAPTRGGDSTEPECLNQFVHPRVGNYEIKPA